MANGRDRKMDMKRIQIDRVASAFGGRIIAESREQEIQRLTLEFIIDEQPANRAAQRPDQ